ncbi:hypothetical protein NBRC111894_2743 [Sporolactobacillus inulinus]|uniref:Uncharacterized protein n=1 Tax=Sporolactobacillus inulinus TaxID=2078 RepID=A0A4Y1ZDT1_9BACL|nr:hypothetical protein NBRC111894_2743 [Sporolactobacillus inulinus]
MPYQADCRHFSSSKRRLLLIGHETVWILIPPIISENFFSCSANF